MKGEDYELKVNKRNKIEINSAILKEERGTVLRQQLKTFGRELRIAIVLCAILLNLLLDNEV